MKNGREVILFACGNADMKDAVSAFMEDKSYISVVVEDGEGALNYLKDDPYDTDLVVASADLAGLSGIELLKMLKLSQRMKGAPFVLVTGRETADSLEGEAMEQGAEDIIRLPCDKRALSNRLHNILVSKGRPMCTNIMEKVVEKELDQYQEKLNVCRCRQCRKDVLTLALNRLKPRYVSTERGRLISAVDQMSYEYLPEILLAITASAETVKKNPRHEIYEM